MDNLSTFHLLLLTDWQACTLITLYAFTLFCSFGCISCLTICPWCPTCLKCPKCPKRPKCLDCPSCPRCSGCPVCPLWILPIPLCWRVSNVPFLWKFSSEGCRTLLGSSHAKSRLCKFRCPFIASNTRVALYFSSAKVYPVLFAVKDCTSAGSVCSRSAKNLQTFGSYFLAGILDCRVPGTLLSNRKISLTL